MGSMKAFAIAALAVVSMCALGAQTNDPVALAARVQQRYNGIKDISGDFVQTYEGGVLRGWRSHSTPRAQSPSWRV